MDFVGYTCAALVTKEERVDLNLSSSRRKWKWFERGEVEIMPTKHLYMKF